MKIYRSLPPLFRPVKAPPTGQHDPLSDFAGNPAAGTAPTKSERGQPAQLPLLPDAWPTAAFKLALRSFWRLMARSDGVSPEQAARARDDVLRLEDEVGEPRASELRHQWEAEWHRETGLCPRCGEAGERHP